MKPSQAKEREYALDHRLAALADSVTYKLVTAQPPDPIAAIVATLRDQRGLLVAPPTLPAPGEFEAAKAYLQRYAIADTLNHWMKQLLRTRPEKPVDWSIAYFTRVAGVEHGVGFGEPSPQQQQQQQQRHGGTSTRGRSDSVATSSVAASIQQQPQPPQRNPTPCVLVLFYSAYGHAKALAQAAAEGAQEYPGARVELRRVPETLPEDVVDMQSIQHDTTIPEATLADFAAADGIIFGFGARFGTAPAQLCALLDTTGGLWARAALVGKPAAMLVSTGTQHGGHEMAAYHFSRVILHHGMVLVGPRPKDADHRPPNEPQGGGHFAAGTIAGKDGSRVPTASEREVARSLGERVADIAARITSPYH